MICLSSAGSLASFDGGARKERDALLPNGGRAAPRDLRRESNRRQGEASEDETTQDYLLAHRPQPRDERATARDERSFPRHDPMKGHTGDAPLHTSAGAQHDPNQDRCAPRPTRTADEAAPRGVEAPLEDTCSQEELASAICVQRFDDSLNSAIRTTYRISLRSSSLREPRYPSARVVWYNIQE